jgi:glyoxylase-like metal-dependent hydrolase (beta-lactamase superfamily II)/rhodanese-related sulfurtransferase
MDLQLFVTPGLGDNSYLLRSGGEAVLVDPQRDVWRFLDAAQGKGLSIRYILETHVHNDYVSGAREVQEAVRAEIVASKKGAYAFPHRGVAEGDEVHIGSVRLVVLETPGHTPEHVSYVVYEGDSNRPLAVFSGGSLIVGSAGRSDLLGPERAEELARAQFRSTRVLAALPESVQLLPTHGAGSFCVSTTPSLSRTSTIGQERTSNPTLTVESEREFVRTHLTGLPAYPAYYSHMAPINRAGPRILRARPTLKALTTAEAADRIAAGAWVIDGRERSQFAAAHTPGAINVELGSSFSTYVGWVTPFDAPLVLVLPEPEGQSADEAVMQLMRIGYDRVQGYLAGGLTAWQEAGMPARSYPTATVDDLCHAYLNSETLPRVLDVRQDTEWRDGHIPGSTHIFIGDLAKGAASLPKEGPETWTICASGFRSSIAASILDREGAPVRAVIRDGVPEWMARCFPRAAREASPSR